MFSFFEKFSNGQLQISFELVDAIFSAICKSNKNSLKLQVKGLKQPATAVWYAITESFEHKHELNWLKKNHFANGYELLNQKMINANCAPFDPEISLAFDYQYDLFTIYFETKPEDPMQKEILKTVTCTFYFYFVCENSEQKNSFRAFMSTGQFNTGYASFYAANYIPNINNPDEKIKPYILQLERILMALVQYFNIPVGKGLQKKYPHQLIFNGPTLADFERIIRLVNLQKPDSNRLTALATELFNDFNRDWSSIAEEISPEYSSAYLPYFPRNFDVLLPETEIWNSDWKFDPEDMEYAIANMLNLAAWTFDYPENTYSHDLFPYIQTALQKDGFCLMGFDTQGDSYMFFIARAKNIDEILDLSTLLSLGIELY